MGRALIRTAFSTLVVMALVMLASCKKTPAAADPVLTKCKSDGECVYVTKGRGDCCVNPCGGQSKAVHQDEAAAISSYNADFCVEASKQCPQAGACAQPTRAPASPARCVNGGCVEGASAPAPSGT